MWQAIAALAGAQIVTGFMGMNQAASDAADARGDAKDANDSALAVQREQLAFQKEQYNEWKDIYGPIEKNLANFYNSLTPEQVISSGLQHQQKAYQDFEKGIETTAAQRGFDSPVIDSLKLMGAFENAEAKATIRADAPLKVAEAKSGFLSKSRPQPGVDAYGDIAETYRRSADQYSADARGYDAQGQQGVNQVGQGLSSLAYLYANNKGDEVTKPNYSGGYTYNSPTPKRTPTSVNTSSTAFLRGR